MAYIEKRGNNWRVRFKRPDGSYGTDPDKFDNKTAAKQRAEEIEAEERAGTFVDPTLSTTKLGKYVPGWFDRMRFQIPNDRTKRSQWRKHIEPKWGDWEFRAIARMNVQEWVNEMTDAGVGGRSVNAIYGTFRQIMRHAEVDGYVPKNPCVMITLPDGTPEERENATPLEVLRLAAAVGPFFPVVLATAYTGFRWGEATGIKRDLVRHHPGDNGRRKGRRVFVHNRAEAVTLADGKPRKGHSYRDLALPDWLAEIFDEQLASHDSEYVFPSDRGKVLRPKAFRELWVPARDRIKPGFHFHDLRHTHETWMEADRTPEVLRNKRMGHKSGKMSQHYAHVEAAMEDDLMADLTKRWNASLEAMGVESWRRLWCPGGDQPGQEQAESS